MIIQMPEIQFAKDVLHGNESAGVLFIQIGLRLFDIVTDSPYMKRESIANYQPHLIYLIQIIN